jgi:hypothetical protein
MSVATEAAGAIRSAISDGAWDAASLVAQVRRVGLAAPFDELTVRFCTDLSAELIAGRVPQVVALGYWLRASSIRRLEHAFRALESDSVLLVPRGLVFHVTPANVDTVFVYSWVLSMLVGNANIVRVSSRSTDIQGRLLQGIARAISEPAYESLAARNRIVVTPHDDATARTLSAAADVRVVWGGNATVEHFRQFELPVRGRDVTFPNRHSLAVLDVDAVTGADDDEIASLADRFFNDAYWFDQGACSSPRLVLWRAPTAGSDRIDRARERFKEAVSAAIGRRSYEAQTGMAINKLAFALQQASTADGFQIDTRSNEATWVLIPSMGAYDRDNCGGGLFFEYVSSDLAGDLANLVTTQDQTAATYGIDQGDLRDLAQHLNGRGIDRWVPIGRALEFESVWDGYDLIQEFAKRVAIRS